MNVTQAAPRTLAQSLTAASIVLAVAAAYWALGLFGTYYFAGHGLFPAPIWLPAAVAFAACWRSGYLGLAGLFLGSLGINGLSQQVPPPYAIVVSLANGVGPWLAITLLKRLTGGAPPFFNARLVRHFLWLGVGVAALITALGGAAVLALWRGLSGEPLLLAFLRWWLSDASGTLLFTPALMLWLLPPQQADQLPEGGSGEGALLATLTLAGALWVLNGITSRSGAYAGLPYLLILPITWAAARLPLRYAHLLSVAVVLLAIVGAVDNRGAFYVDSNSQALMSAGLMIVTQTVVLLVLGALVTERRLAEERLREANQTLEDKVAERTRQLVESEARFKLVADAAPFPLVMNDYLSGAVTYANPRAEAMFGDSMFAEDGLRAQNFYVDPADWTRMAAALQSNGHVYDLEVQLADASGRHFWALLSCAVVRYDNRLYVLTGINDISERKELEHNLQAANEALRQQVTEIEALQHGLREQAVHDALTGLHNRRYLDETLEKLLTHMHAIGQPVSIVMLDVDHFKTINDSHGHKVGDQVLAMLGTLLAERFRAGDIVCRYGGEEFVAVLPGSPLEDARAKCEQLREEIAALEVPLVDGGMLHLTSSMGVATSPEHGSEAEWLLQLADAALYAAKAGGRNRVVTAGSLMSQRADPAGVTNADPEPRQE
jgi:diguanylate cyclase (GGDEF)-like protein/PAS domain S-box-containing protein